MSKIALCVFATGRYQEFLPDLARTARLYFHVDQQVELVALTDGDVVPEGFDRHFHVPHLRWPLGTLYRYRWLAQQTGELQRYDYLFMCDADMRFVGPVGPEALGRLVAVLHAGHLTKRAKDLPFEHNKRSQACVPDGEGEHYYAGGFQGGLAKKYLRACAKIDEGIRYDERRHQIAEWHDESHWNAYLVKNPPTVKLPPPYCWGEPEGCPPGTRILALAKDHAAYRQGGADPRAIEPASDPDAIPTVQEMTQTLRQSRIQEPMLGRITTTLKQIWAVQERAAPRVCHDGPQGDLEDVLLDLLPSGPVVYVDVGAAEPVDCSNTWPLYTLGGRGLLIEPRPSCWPSLLRQRPRDHLWPTAVARQEGFAEMIECGGCSSIEPVWTREVRGRMMVPTMRLRDILDQFPEIRDTAQLCSIDVEGSEEQAIESCDWSIFRPEIVIVEHGVFEPSRDDGTRPNRLAALMGERNYEMVHRDNLNLVFRRINDP